ncbi:hypothetical protein ACTXT7_003730 [Hymenolepis weldensis]
MPIKFIRGLRIAPPDWCLYASFKSHFKKLLKLRLSISQLNDTSTSRHYAVSRVQVEDPMSINRPECFFSEKDDKLAAAAAARRPIPKIVDREVRSIRILIFTDIKIFVENWYYN